MEPAVVMNEDSTSTVSEESVDNETTCVRKPYRMRETVTASPCRQLDKRSRFWWRRPFVLVAGMEVESSPAARDEKPSTLDMREERRVDTDERKRSSSRWMATLLLFVSDGMTGSLAWREPCRPHARYALSVRTHPSSSRQKPFRSTGRSTS